MARKDQPTDPHHPTVSNPGWVQEIYERSRQPRAWLRVAKMLRAAADAVFERENPTADRFYGELLRGARSTAEGNPPPTDFDDAKFPMPNFGAALMLMAFAIENLLKGLAIKKGKVKFSKQELPSSLKSHDLDRLRQLAAPRATVAQHILDNLTYMSWAGRYPCPTEAAEFWPMRDGAALITGASWPDTHNDVLAYYNALAGELQDLIDPGDTGE
jgi:hypothetical protein